MPSDYGCAFADISDEVTWLHETYVLYVENGNTPLLSLPYTFREVAQLVNRFRWQAQTEAHREITERQKSRDRLAKAGIPT